MPETPEIFDYEESRWSQFRTRLRNTKEKLADRAKIFLKETWAFRSNITVEPFIVCYVFPSVLIGMTVQNLCFHKACLVNLGYDNETCDHIMHGNKDQYLEQEENVQRIVTTMTAWSHPLQTATPGILALFLGAWSDRTGNRKSLMIFPIIGKLVATVGIILSTVFFLNVDVMMTALIEGLPPALAGGRVAVTMAVYSYVTDITTESERTFRLGVVTATMTLSRPVGLALSGYMTNRTHYICVFSTALLIFLAGFIYVTTKLESNPKKITVGSETETNSCYFLFSINDLVATVNVAFKKRENSRRLQIFLIVFSYMLIVGPVLGEAQLSYWYARHKFNFNEIDNSLFLTHSFVVGSIGSYITLYLFMKKWRFDDVSIGMIACLSRISASVAYAVAPTRSVLFTAPVLDMFSSAGAASLRSIATKLVSPDETGKIVSLISISEALVTVIYTPIYSKVYDSTIHVYPGSFYMISTALAIFAMIFLRFIAFLRRKEAFAKTLDKPRISNVVNPDTEVTYL